MHYYNDINDILLSDKKEVNAIGCTMAFIEHTQSERASLNS